MADESKEQNTDQPDRSPRAHIEYVVPDPEAGPFTTYANDIKMAWTHFDIRMVFGEVVDTLPDKIIVEQRAQVTISYLQAKLLWHMLAQAISQYEAIFGEIKLPPEALVLQTLSATGKPDPGSSFRK